MTRQRVAWWKPILHPFWWYRHRHLTNLIRRNVRLTYAAKCERQTLLDYFEPRTDVGHTLIQRGGSDG